MYDYEIQEAETIEPEKEVFNPDAYESKKMNTGLFIINWKLKYVPPATYPKFLSGDRVEYKNKKIWSKKGTVVANFQGGHKNYVNIAWDNNVLNITEHKGNLNNLSRLLSPILVGSTTNWRKV